MRGYLISMAVRTACVVLAVICPPPARWVVLAGAIVLPYMAVLLANAGRDPAAGAASGVPEHRADTTDRPRRWSGTRGESSVIPRSSTFDTLRTGEVQPPEATGPPRKGG